MNILRKRRRQSFWIPPFREIWDGIPVNGRKPYLSLVQSDRLYINGVAAEGRIGEFLKRYLEENREGEPYRSSLDCGRHRLFQL